MHKPKSKTKAIALITAFFATALLGVWLFRSRPPLTKNYDAFAKCLAEKKITMYGASWCSHCQNEKKAFGSSFQYVPYVECPRDPQQCLAASVSGYPTWIWPDGRRLEGEQGLQGLSAASSCPLP